MGVQRKKRVQNLPVQNAKAWKKIMHQCIYIYIYIYTYIYTYIYLKWFFIQNYKKLHNNKSFFSKFINKINGKLKLLYRKDNVSRRSFAEYSSMFLFSYILIMCVQPGTLISMDIVKIVQNKYIHFCLKLDKMHHLPVWKGV